MTTEGSNEPPADGHEEVPATEPNQPSQSRWVAALARAVDDKDPYTRSHSETVADLCAKIGIELGLDADRVAKLRVAGVLHDVGKIGTPDEILHKRGELTETELKVIKEHPGLGARIAEVAGLEEEASWILHHHERPDGTGYPDRLTGDDIPLESRIIHVADTYEAITSDRPYSEARSEREALAEIERHAGTQFDPDCVAALRVVLRLEEGGGGQAPAAAGGNG